MSIWEENCNIKKHQFLDTNVKSKVVIIGGGIAGILIACKLIKKGIEDVIILEADRILSGQTIGTTAKITSQHGMCYAQLIKNHGKEIANLYAKANENAILQYKNIIENEKIDCDFMETKSFLYSVDNEEEIIKEIKVCESLNLPVSFTYDTELPFEIKGSAVFTGQAVFNPIKFLSYLSQNLKIYEKTKVLRIEGDTIITDKAKVQAESIVFACHYPFVNIPGLYFTRMHQERSYVISLKNVPTMKNMYLGTGSVSYSFRSYKDNILFGGGSHRTGENKVGDTYKKLITMAKEYYPECEITNMWSAQDSIPADNIPYIGKFSKSKPNWYVATGFKKWGMTTSMISADIISDMIIGRKNEYEQCFTPQRFNKSAVTQITKDLAKAVKSITKEIAYIPKKKIDDIGKGCASIVTHNGEKIGVYKNEAGNVYAVNTRCPHLGCCLEWNGDEKSWDCPCHGSRYDYKGNIINSPAQKETIKKDLIL